jgi:hypothetical protein
MANIIKTKRAKVLGKKWGYYIRVNNQKLPINEFKVDLLISRSWIQKVYRNWRVTIIWADDTRVKYFIDNYSDF